MRSVPLSLSFLLVVLFAVACGKSKEEALVDDMVTTSEARAAELESAKDEASAKAAAPRIEQLALQMKAITERQAEMTEADVAKLGSTHGQRMAQATQRLMTAMMQFANKPEAVQKILQPALDKMSDGDGK